MTLNYNDLKKEFFEKQKRLDKEKTAQVIAKAFISSNEKKLQGKK
jgi:hypothetical protein